MPDISETPCEFDLTGHGCELRSTMTLNEKIQQIKEERQAECEHRGYHDWDNPIGEPETQEPTLVLTYGGYKEKGSRTWYYRRTCIHCGKEETTKDNRVWLAEAGYGYWDIDRITGEVTFIDKR